MNHLARLFALFAPATLGVAQVGISITAMAPLAVKCSAPGSLAMDSRPAGPLPLSDFLASSLPGIADVSLGYSCAATTTSVSCSFAHTGSVQASGPSGSTATAGPADYLVTIQSATTNRIELSVDFEDGTAPGTIQPLAFVDLGNDGIVDFVNGVQSVALPQLVVGPQPLLLRVRMDGSALRGGSFTSLLTIGVTPTNDLQMTTAAIGCAGGQVLFGMRRSFLDQGLELGAFTVPSPSPVFVVFGFGVNPLLLPSLGTAPCLLLPSPDIVVPIVNGTLPIALPPTLRPLTFWVQGVLVSPQLLTTDCTRVDAL